MLGFTIFANTKIYNVNLKTNTLKEDNQVTKNPGTKIPGSY